MTDDRKFLTKDKTSDDIVARISYHNIPGLIMSVVAIVAAYYGIASKLDTLHQKIEYSETRIQRLENTIYNVKGAVEYVEKAPTPIITPSLTPTPTKKPLPIPTKGEEVEESA